MNIKSIDELQSKFNDITEMFYDESVLPESISVELKQFITDLNNLSTKCLGYSLMK